MFDVTLASACSWCCLATYDLEPEGGHVLLIFGPVFLAPGWLSHLLQQRPVLETLEIFQVECTVKQEALFGDLRLLLALMGEVRFRMQSSLLMAIFYTISFLSVLSSKCGFPVSMKYACKYLYKITFAKDSSLG